MIYQNCKQNKKLVKLVKLVILPAGFTVETAVPSGGAVLLGGPGGLAIC